MTMRCVEAADERVTLYYYGELAAHEREAFERHLKGCPACAASLAELHAMRAALASRGRAAPPADFTARLMSRLDSNGAVAAFARPRRTRLAWAWLPLAALLVIGIALGLVWQRRALGPAEPAAELQATDARLDAAAERHFERAKLVVLGLAMKDAASGAGDWAYERELAASLLPDTRLFRLAAAERGDARLADLLGDLETVLLQTSMSVEPGAPELQRIQRAIRRRDLLVRMELIEG